MFDEVTKYYVESAIESETNAAVNNHGAKYHSLHEGYAVLKEEVDEARDEQIKIKNELYAMWQSVKLDDKNKTKALAEKIKCNAENLALEAVQVAAVCKKIINSI